MSLFSHIFLKSKTLHASNEPSLPLPSDPPDDFARFDATAFDFTSALRFGKGPENAHGNGVDIKGTKGDDEIFGDAGDNKIKGDKGDDLIFGEEGDDDINAGDGNDTAHGGAGDDNIDGKNGIDTVVFDGSILDFLFDSSAGSGDKIDVTDMNLADGDEGTDKVKHVEFLQFNDFLYEMGENNAPLVLGDDVTTPEDAPTTFTITAYDFEGDALSAPLVSYVGPGTVTLVSTTPLSPLVGGGTSYTFAFDPYGGFDALGSGDSSNEVITVSVTDSAGNTTTQNVTVTVTGVNDPPVANDDAARTDEETEVAIAVLTNDTDPNDDDLTVTTATADNGNVVIEADGSLTYTPNLNFNGADTITYDISDGNGGTDSASVTVTVDPVNDAPVAADDTATTDEDTATTLSVLTNDGDVDGPALSISGTTDPTNGSVVVNADNTITYTPDLNFNGTDTFEYTLTDGTLSDTATATVTVAPVNDAPVANDDGAATNEDVAVSIDVLGNDTDVDLDDLTVTTATADNGNVVIEADGSLTYTPNLNFNGADTITYDISDGNGGTDSAQVAVTVAPVNDPPMSLDIPLTFNEADGPILIDLSTQVEDPDSTLLRFSDIGLAAGSTVIPFSILAGGQISIDPGAIQGLDTGTVLNVSFSYTVTDNSGDLGNDSDTGVVAVTINGLDDPLPPANSPPVANAVTITADEEDGTISVPLTGLISDPDAGDVLTITSLRSDFYFGAEFSSGVDVPFSGGVTLGEGGQLIFDPVDFGLDEGETRSITLTYTVEDSAGLQATNAITLELTGDTPPDPANLPPTAQNLPTSGPFGPGPQDVVVDDPETPTFSIDLSALVDDPDGPNGDLVITPGDLVIGFNSEVDPETGEPVEVPITVPYSFDSETGIVTITLADIGVPDGEGILGALSYTVTDPGGATATGQVTYNYVSPAEDAGPTSLLLDFEGFSVLDPDFSVQIPGIEGFTFGGTATVIETDELETDGSGRTPGGIIGGQTTPGGDNVLVGAASILTVEEPVLDESGQPVLDSRGNPVFQNVEVLGENFALVAPGLTFGVGEQGPQFFGVSGQTFPLPEDFPTNVGTPFDLDSLSVNLTSEGTATVTVTVYTVEIVEEPVNASFSNYFYELVEVDSFDFVIDGSTGATELDFNATDFGIGLTGANPDPSEFDDAFVLTFTTDDGTPVVLDDILVTI